MRFDGHFTAQPAAAVAALFLAMACATPAYVETAPSPAELSELETRVARDSSSVTPTLRLASAYRASSRMRDALPLLERSVARNPNDPNIALMLGATYEDLARFADARRLYRAYLERGASPKLRSAIEQRLPLLQRRELEATVKVALARESELANTPPTPYSVAVFPFQFIGADSQYRFLGRALSEFLVADLSQTNRLKVLERAQVQLLLDEMKLGQSGAVDPATAARTGRMLGAERVVQGSMDGGASEMQLETAIVRVSTVQWSGEAVPAANRPNLVTLSERDALSALITMQKRLALRIYSSLGIQLTEAERARVTHRATENVNAILAYGRGLQAEDAGDFAAAARNFAQSAALDPGFSAARASVDRASNVISASSVRTKDLTAAVTGGAAGAREGPSDFLPNPLARDAVAEILRTEGTSRRSILDVVITRP